MSNDIIDRLREESFNLQVGDVLYGDALLKDDAANEIERLRNILDSNNIAHDESSEKMKVVFDLIDKGQFNKAEDLLVALKKDPAIRYPEIIRAKSLIKFLKT